MFFYLSIPTIHSLRNSCPFCKYIFQNMFFLKKLKSHPSRRLFTLFSSVCNSFKKRFLKSSDHPVLCICFRRIQWEPHLTMVVESHLNRQFFKTGSKRLKKSELKIEFIQENCVKILSLALKVGKHVT